MSYCVVQPQANNLTVCKLFILLAIFISAINTGPWVSRALCQSEAHVSTCNEWFERLERSDQNDYFTVPAKPLFISFSPLNGAAIRPFYTVCAFKCYCDCWYFFVFNVFRSILKKTINSNLYPLCSRIQNRSPFTFSQGEICFDKKSIPLLEYGFSSENIAKRPENVAFVHRSTFPLAFSSWICMCKVTIAQSYCSGKIIGSTSHKTRLWRYPQLLKRYSL